MDPHRWRASGTRARGHRDGRLRAGHDDRGSGDGSGSHGDGGGRGQRDTGHHHARDRHASAASPAVPDGRTPVYLTGLDASQKTVTFDLIQFLTGDEAKTEWKKEHPENPDGPDNDYLIVNNSSVLQTLPVAADAQCVVLSTLGGTDTKTISFAAFPAFLKQQSDDMTPTAPDIAVLPFWLTVQHGTVVKFEEQFLP